MLVCVYMYTVDSRDDASTFERNVAKFHFIFQNFKGTINTNFYSKIKSPTGS